MIQFGRRLKQLRGKRKLTQQALGELADVRQATISGLESGATQRVEFGALERIARALHVEPAALFEKPTDR